LTPERWIQKIEEKTEKASRRYRIMTEHRRNGRAFADDDGLPGILLTQEEYSDNTLRKSLFDPDECWKTHKIWGDSYVILKEVRKVFEFELLTKKDIKE